MTAKAWPSGAADESLRRLKEGNARFVSGHARFPTVQKEVLAELAKGQQPHTTVLGCSDSRVPPELVFDAGFGELFVVRVAGNVLGPSILGTLQFAATHLHTPLFVVMGHEGCGAVNAAIDWNFHGAAHKRRIAICWKISCPPSTTSMGGSLARCCCTGRLRRTCVVWSRNS